MQIAGGVNRYQIGIKKCLINKSVIDRWADGFCGAALSEINVIM